MKYLAILATVVGAYGQSYGSFSSTSYGMNGEEITVTTGTYTAPKPSTHDEIMAIYRRMNDELIRDIAESRRAYDAQEQIDELRRQTQLLKEICEKK